MTNSKILVAGATGYLGQHLVKVLLENKANFAVLARNHDKAKRMGLNDEQIIVAEVTKPETLSSCMQDVDLIISTVGITRQKDGLTYQDVDYQANLNLLEQAEKSGVAKFIYVSAFNAPSFTQVRLLAAKEKFAQRLLSSTSLSPCVVRPNGFFSDLEEALKLAHSGRGFLFGDGAQKLNPIDGDDLARFIISHIESCETEINVGGPDILSHLEITQLAFQALNKPAKITKVPDWVRQLMLWGCRHLPERFTGPMEFFLTVSAQDMIAPTYGCKRLIQHYQQVAKNL